MINTNSLAKAGMVRGMKMIALMLMVVAGFTMTSYCVITKTNPLSLVPLISCPSMHIHRSPGAISYDTAINWDREKNVGHFVSYADMKDSSGLADVYIVSSRQKMWSCDAQSFGNWVYISGSQEIVYCAHEVNNWIVWNATKEDAALMTARVTGKQKYLAAREWAEQEYHRDIADFKYLELDTSAVVQSL